MSEEYTKIPPSADPVEIDDIQPDLFQISVKGTGVELTRTVDQVTALHVIATVLGGGAAAPAAAGATTYVPQSTVAAPSVETQRKAGYDAAASEGLDPHTTIGEYIDECGATQFSAKITAIGNFLELRLGQSSFTREEVKSQFRPAGEAQPGNYSRDFNDAITQRWIAEDPNEKGQYFVTKTGKTAIASKFDKSTRRAAPPRRRKTTSKTDSGDSSTADNGFQDLDVDE
ncbi:hypothetical protein [Mycobacterium sp. 155]|uniref:hypothetical protein n=1 Tax=Mycobacterium sp. 155 TaxID=1157943 RepID=UPI00036D09EB|nr:hypothetical protein [Mycobacterium sp. 155]